MKMIKISTCWECRDSLSHIGLEGLRCGMFGRRRIEDTSNIPDWCPLDDAPDPEIVDIESLATKIHEQVHK